MWVYIWLAVTAAALIIEFCTNEMVSVWFAGGGIVAMIIAAFNVSWYVHVPVFIGLSLVLLLSFRKIVLKFLDKGEQRTNADLAIGKEYALLTEIGFNAPGTIKINDVIWNAVTENQNEKITAGTVVRVVAIKGNKYIVEKII
ncbi:MAG: NfeD family protein [Clostridia bacterium]|nr:NfeD family protein [Clostridia bacterium]MBR2449751.1 NfeD family protein [Clostridia bacterium]